MARGKGKRPNKGKGGGGDGGASIPRTDKWEVPSDNPKFRKYYEAQKIMQPEQWGAFVAAMTAPLPTTFRVTGSKATAQELNEYIKTQHIPSLTGIEFEGQKVDPPKQISWFPQGLVWQLNLAKRVLRKSEEFRRFQLFLVYETDAGNISRQELVSMIPPLLLDVQPHHYVMDMCAAPGSKSAQLIEALHATDPSTAASLPAGLLIANDSDYKRTHMLVHQAGRLASPALMVTNLDATMFPNIKIPAASAKSHLTTLKFDRILCDVPCTGDGTLRKNINIWRDWSVTAGNGMHGLQLRILLRGLQMLKPGGFLVYSTCSLNPVENEAILAAALNRTSGDINLVDVSDKLPGLIRHPGVSNWTVAVDKLGTLMNTYAEYEEFMEGKDQKRFLQTCWPPENAGSLNLNRCLRILPQDQDTGGFFVALLHKAAKPELVPYVPEPSAPQKRKADDNPDGQPDQKKTKAELDDVEPEGTTGGSYVEQPFHYISEENEQLKEGLLSLNLQPTFPSHLLFARSAKGDALRSIYLTNNIIKSIVQHNDTERIRLINCGTKVIAEHGTGASARAFRFLYDGVSLVLPHVPPEEILEASIPDLKVLLALYNPTFAELDDPLRSSIQKKTGTSYLVRIAPVENDITSLKHPIFLPLWRAAASAGLLLDKKARSALSLRVFGEDVSPVGQGQTKKTGEKDTIGIPTEDANSDPEAASAIVVDETGQEVEAMEP